MLSHLLKLTLVTYRQATPIDQYLKFIETCAKAGVTFVQLREKSDVPDDFLLGFGRDLKALLSSYGIPLIVNDRVDIACQIDAAGVHIGQRDSHALIARSMLGDDKWIGLSVDAIEHVRQAQRLPIDYLGATIFPSQSKKDIEKLWGLEGLKKITQISQKPIVGIGGMNTTNTDVVMQEGAAGIAVIGAIHRAIDPVGVIQCLRAATEKTDQNRLTMRG
ncbi:MAG: thiamine-phosphate synthase [marine bacterium B5-7]|nr:MAG: thiamine-phosphate synthase [marine bacterium B5-7]